MSNIPQTIGYNRNTKISRRLSKSMEQKLQNAHNKLILGQNYRQKMREAAWQEAYDQYMGSKRWRYSADDRTADLVNINVSFSTINTLVPFVADEDPKFLIEPESGDASAEYATILEAYINRLWRSKDFEGQVSISEATFDYLVYGDGFLKIGYKLVDRPSYDVNGDPIGEGRITVAEFFVDRVSPWDVWIDPYSDGLHNARWICQRIVLPASELKSDKRYKLVEDIEGTELDGRHSSPEDRDRLDETTGYVTIYEFYDLVDRWMLTFTADGSQPIRYIEHVKCPLVQLHNYRVPNSPYHMGELENISSLQDELNKTRSQMLTHRRRNVMKWLVRTNAVDEEGLEAMRSSRVNDVVPIKGTDPFEMLVAPVTPTPLSGDSYMIEERIRQDINEISGVNEYLRGMPQGISRTATEATILEGATNIRTRHKLLQIETAARQTGQLLLDIIQDVLPETDFREMSLHVTGREAERLNRVTGQDVLATGGVINPTPELFQGSYRVEVERGSTELRNPQIKSQKMREIVTMILNGFPILMEMQIPFDMQRLLRLWLEAEGIDDVDALFEMNPNQGALQQMMLMQQAQSLLGGGAQPGAAAGGAVGAPTPPGAPRPQTTRPPADLPSEDNSGIIAPRY